MIKIEVVGEIIGKPDKPYKPRAMRWSNNTRTKRWARSSILERLSTLGPTLLHPVALLNYNSMLWLEGLRLWCQKDKCPWNFLLVWSWVLLPFFPSSLKLHKALSTTTHSGSWGKWLWPVSGHGQKRNGTRESAYFWAQFEGKGKEQNRSKYESIILAWHRDGRKVSRWLNILKEKLGKLCDFVLSKNEDVLEVAEAMSILGKDPSCTSNEMWGYLMKRMKTKKKFS